MDGWISHWFFCANGCWILKQQLHLIRCCYCSANYFPPDSLCLKKKCLSGGRMLTGHPQSKFCPGHQEPDKIQSVYVQLKVCPAYWEQTMLCFNTSVPAVNMLRKAKTANWAQYGQWDFAPSLFGQLHIYLKFSLMLSLLDIVKWETVEGIPEYVSNFFFCQ